MKYTPQQKMAIETVDENLVVTAGAGAGKTRVLVDRLLYILKKGLAQVDEIVAITYTNKAATEIKDRLRGEVKKLKDNENFAKIRRKLGMSYIGTIHSFCFRLLQENPVEANIDPTMEVIEEYRAKALLKDSVREAILRKLDEDAVFHLTSEMGYNRLTKEIYKTIEKMQNQGLRASALAQVAMTEDEKIVASLIEEALSQYEKKKERLGVLDFEDLLQKTLELFENHREILKFYQNKFKYIMIDEYQDLNFSQDKILRCLGDGTNLFVVGDKKQSIYGFRGARVELFEKLKKDLQRQGRAINLMDNFRSEEKIIDFVNTSFENLMEDYEPIVPHRRLEGIPNIHFIVPESVGLVGERKQQEGELIARKILAMMNDDKIKIYDKVLSDYRSPTFKDFSVLLRRRTHIRDYVKAFTAYKIPFYLSDTGGLTEGTGVKTMINVLKTIETKDEISLYGTLSNLFNIDDRELTSYVLAEKRLISGLELEDELDEDGVDNLARAFEQIHKWIAEKDRLSLYELAREIINKTNLFFKASKLDSQEVENLLKFLDLCKEYDDLGYTLQEFLAELEDFGEDYKEAIDITEDEDVVRFITIHSSKGLEFPIVILADCSQDIKANTSDIVFEPELGMALKKDKTKWDSIKDGLLKKEIDEAKRLLYVAITRARDHLVISGEMKQSKKESFLKWLTPQGINDETRTIVTEELEDLEAKDVMPIPEEQATDSGFLRRQFCQKPKSKVDVYSVTVLGDFLRCPKRYYLSKIVGISETMFYKQESEATGLSALERGKIVHRIIEEIHKGNFLIKDLDKALEIYLEEDRSFILQCIENYLKSGLYRKGKTIYSELPFTYCIKDRCHVNGVIDQLQMDHEGVTIIDFKTNTQIDEDILKSYILQVQTYALVIRDIYKTSIKSAVLAFLYKDRMMDIDISSRALNQCQDKLLNIISTIEREDFMIGRGFNCDYCGYKEIICK